MKNILQGSGLVVLAMVFSLQLLAQKNEMVKVAKSSAKNKIDVFIGDKIFTSFLYPDTLEKPVLYPGSCCQWDHCHKGFSAKYTTRRPN